MVLVCIVAAVGWLVLHGAPPPPRVATEVVPAVRPAAYSAQDRRMSFIVLPFDNLNGEAAQNGVAERITRDLTDRIATDTTIPVVSATTAAVYRGKATDLRAIGRDYEVHFALTGSAQRQGGRLIVAATLYQIADERSLWSRRFDRPAGSEVLGAIVRSIYTDAIQAAINAEVARARGDHPDSLDARDFYLASLESSLLPFNKANRLAQIALLDKALALDPDNRQALAQAARERAIVVLNGWSSDRRTDLAFATKTVDRLLTSRPRDVSLLTTRALVLRAQGDLDQALAVRRLIAEIDPQLADNHREIGAILQTQGHFAEALDSFTLARRLVTPFNADATLDGQTAAALLATNRVTDAITMARQAIAEAASGTADTPWLTLIAAENVNGQDEQARADLQKYLALKPTRPTLAEVRKFSFLAGVPNLLEGLQRAGMPAQ